MLKMSENALESKLQLDMTNWKCTGREFDVEVALNGGCVTVVFLHGWTQRLHCRQVKLVLRRVFPGAKSRKIFDSTFSLLLGPHNSIADAQLCDYNSHISLGPAVSVASDLYFSMFSTQEINYCN